MRWWSTTYIYHRIFDFGLLGGSLILSYVENVDSGIQFKYKLYRIGAHWHNKTLAAGTNIYIHNVSLRSTRYICHSEISLFCDLSHIQFHCKCCFTLKCCVLLHCSIWRTEISFVLYCFITMHCMNYYLSRILVKLASRAWDIKILIVGNLPNFVQE